jgi:hypothetical protein
VELFRFIVPPLVTVVVPSKVSELTGELLLNIEPELLLKVPPKNNMVDPDDPSKLAVKVPLLLKVPEDISKVIVSPDEEALFPQLTVPLLVKVVDKLAIVAVPDDEPLPSEPVAPLFNVSDPPLTVDPDAHIRLELTVLAAVPDKVPPSNTKELKAMLD